MRAMASQITIVSIVCSTVCSCGDQKITLKLRVIGLCEGNSPANSPVTSPHKGPVTRKMFPFDDVIIKTAWSPFRVLRKKFDGGCAAPVFEGGLRKISSKTSPGLRRISWSWAHSYVISWNFSPNIPLSREIFRKQTIIYLPKCQFLVICVKNIPMAKDFGRKIYPSLRNFCQKYTLG